MIRVLQESLAAAHVERIHGIVNGTTNYILSEMARAGISYEQALGQAQELGYAEADPTDDVTGRDAAAKMTGSAAMVTPRWTSWGRSTIWSSSSLRAERTSAGGMAAELASLVDRRDDRILDLMIVTKDDDGTSTPSRSTTSRVSMSCGRWRPSWPTCWPPTTWRTSRPPWSLAAWRACSSGRTGGRRRSLRLPPAGGQLVANGRTPVQAILASMEVDGVDERRRLTCPSDVDELDGAA